MSDVIEFTVSGVLRGAKYPLGPTPAKVSVALVLEGHTDTRADLPVPDEALEAIYRYVREMMPEQVLLTGHGGTVSVTVTIQGGP